MPEQLMKELTAHRTLALRDAVAANPRAAMTLLLHKLVTDQFRRTSQGACLEASVRQVYFPAQAADLKTSRSAASVDERQHVMAFAPTRSGKGVGLVVPTLLSWTGSAVIHDIKG